MLTQDLSDAAIALRKTITDAREPDALLFETVTPSNSALTLSVHQWRQIQKRLMRFLIPYEVRFPS